MIDTPLPVDTCHVCGTRMRWGLTAPSPIIEAGCPHCNAEAARLQRERADQRLREAAMQVFGLSAAPPVRLC